MKPEAAKTAELLELRQSIGRLYSYGVAVTLLLAAAVACCLWLWLQVPHLGAGNTVGQPSLASHTFTINTRRGDRVTRVPFTADSRDQAEAWREAREHAAWLESARGVEILGIEKE